MDAIAFDRFAETLAKGVSPRRMRSRFSIFDLQIFHTIR
jgi:hypothetical protein